MARRILVPAGTAGASSSGAGGGGIISAPSAVSKTRMGAFNYTYDDTAGSLTQLNANQFMYMRAGDNRSNNIYWVAQAFQVDDNGVITLGSSAQQVNSSGTSESTDIHGTTAAGSISHISRWHYNGSYYINHVQFHCNSSNQVAASDRYSPGDYNTSYMHPQSGAPIASGSWTGTSGTRYVAYAGSNNSGHGGYTIWNNNGHYTGGTLNSYSSTSGGAPCMQWYNDTSSRMGYGYDHRSQSNGYYWSIFHSGTSVAGIGYQDNVLGNANARNDYQNNVGLAYVDTSNPSDVNNRGILLHTFSNGYYLTNKSGGNANSNQVATGSLPILGTSINDSYSASIPCGINKFLLSGSDGVGAFADISVNSSNEVNIDTFNNSFIQVRRGFWEENAASTNGSNITRCAIGGNNNQFLISVYEGLISVYDISSFVDLSEHVSV